MIEWQPIETVPEGEMVIVWAENLNRGLPSAEVVMVFKDGPDPGDWAYWTNGGPNAGDDLHFDPPPTRWSPVNPPPD
jgi:hypothetical protein